MYGRSDKMAMLWVTGVPLQPIAKQMVAAMEDAIETGESPFTPVGILDVNGRQVYELTGMGQRHYYFRSGADLIKPYIACAWVLKAVTGYDQNRGCYACPKLAGILELVIKELVSDKFQPAGGVLTNAIGVCVVRCVKRVAHNEAVAVVRLERAGRRHIDANVGGLYKIAVPDHPSGSIDKDNPVVERTDAKVLESAELVERRCRAAVNTDICASRLGRRGCHADVAKNTGVIGGNGKQVSGRGRFLE